MKVLPKEGRGEAARNGKFLAADDKVQMAFIEVPVMHVSKQSGHCQFPKAITFPCAESLPLKEKVSKVELTFKSYLCSSALRLALL